MIEHGLQERLRPLGLRVSENRLGRALLDDAAAVEHCDPIGHFAREPHLVRDDEKRYLHDVRDIANDVEHLPGELWIQRGRDLVQEKDLGA